MRTPGEAVCPNRTILTRAERLVREEIFGNVRPRLADLCGECRGRQTELQLVVLVLGVVVLLIGGTVFAAWRSERVDRDDEPPSGDG